MKSKVNELNNKIISNIKGSSIYKDHYDRLLNKVSNINYLLESYTEIHHIIPRSLNGSNDKSNLIRVNYSDHFNLHKLLMLHFNSINCIESSSKMSSAFLFMCSTYKGVKINNSKDFTLAKNIDRNRKIELYGNPMGQCHTNEAKSKSLSTRLEKYGTPFVKCSNKEIRNKVKETNLKKFGSIMGMCHTAEAKMKNIKVREDKFGNACGQMHSNEVRIKSNETKIKLYGNVCGMMHTKESKQKGRDTTRSRMIKNNEFLSKQLILFNELGEIEYSGVSYDVIKYLGVKWQTVIKNVGTNLSIRTHGKWKNYLLNYSEESSETIP